MILEQLRVVDPSANNCDWVADLAIENGKVYAIDVDLGSKLKGNGIVTRNCSGMWAFPGFIDMHVHLREPGHEYKEDILSGSKAGLSSGFTALACMANTQPVNDNRAVTEMMIARSKCSPGPRLFPYGAISKGILGKELTEMADLKEAGAIGVSDDGKCVMDARLMRHALEYAASFDLLVSQHCEDDHLAFGGVMHEGVISNRLGLRGWPREAEDIIVARDLILNKRIKARYHVAHVSTLGAVELIREAKSKGQRVSAEVTPHHLSLTHKEVLGYRTECKVNPPLREEEDVAAMVQALKDGTIDCVATDHAPHSTLEKDCLFDEAAFGMTGLESAIGVMLELVHTQQLSLVRFAEVLSTAPAKLLGIEGGSLKPGCRADFVIIDPQKEFTFHGQFSKSNNSPWNGKKMRGVVEETWIMGENIYRRDA